MRSASRTATQAPRPYLPFSIEALLERMNRRGVVEALVPLPLEQLVACATPAGVACELARRVAGDAALLQLVEWEPVDVEYGAVLLLVRGIAPEDTLRARLAAAHGEDGEDVPAGKA